MTDERDIEYARTFAFGTVRVAYDLGLDCRWHWRMDPTGCPPAMLDHLGWSTHGHLTRPDAYQAAVFTALSKDAPE